MTSAPHPRRDGTSPGPLQRVLSSKLGRFLKFGLVGGSGVLVNLAVFKLVFFLLSSLALEASLRHVLANIAGVLVSIFTNFLLNDRWTWADRHKGMMRDALARLVRYYAVCSAAALVQVGVSALLFNAFFEGRTLSLLGVNVAPEIPVLVGIICGMAINFPLSHYWAFRDARRAEASRLDDDGAES